MRQMDRLPDRVVMPLLGLGTWIAVCVMARQRGYSCAYLSVMFGRRPRWREVWRHFFTYTQAMMARIRAAERGVHRCTPQPSFKSFRTLMESSRPALLGTFHFGHSDLLGFLLGEFRRHVYMVRLRVDNSQDTHVLADRFGEWVTYMWVNQNQNLLFALKDAAQSGGSIAMMCDQIEHSSKVEAFDLLGARRLMPFTIYHLSCIFRLPIVFCLSVPGAANESLLHASSIFEPDMTSKEENLARARVHFQTFLRQLESLLRSNPYLWFNPIPQTAESCVTDAIPGATSRPAPAPC